MRIPPASRSLVFALLLPFVVGCAAYSPAGKSFRHWRTGLRVTLPPGWLRYGAAKQDLMLTSDGLRLESISISLHRMGKKLPGTERTYRKEMLPAEVAELSLGLLESGGYAKNLRVERIGPVTVAGRDGYRADALFVDGGGLTKRMRLYGTVLGEYVCEMRFEGAETVYYTKHLPAFEVMVASASAGSR